MKKMHDEYIKTHNLETDSEYLEQSNYLIKDSLAKGYDVAEFPDGTIVTTLVKITEVRYAWDNKLRKMVKISSRRDIL